MFSAQLVPAKIVLLIFSRECVNGHVCRKDVASQKLRKALNMALACENTEIDAFNVTVTTTQLRGMTYSIPLRLGEY